MWYLIYNLLLILASPFILLVLLAKKRCRRGLPERLGIFGLSGLSGSFGSQPDEREKSNKPDNPVIWVHAVSLGEVVAAVPLVRALHVRYPAYRLVVSTITETGREAVEQQLAGVAEHCYAPLDFPWVVARVVQRLSPTLFLFVETELWPNLLRTLSRCGVPSILVNGRLSSFSFRGYGLVNPFFRRVLETVTFCLMQSDRDAQRIIALGATPARVLRTGNIKFDQPLPDETAGATTLSRRTIAVDEEEELIVAGSTHPGEEEQLLDGYQQLQREFPQLVLLLAPRHIERAAEVESVVIARGLLAVRRSVLGPPDVASFQPGLSRVVILDTRGELAGAYRHAVLSFVGGTLIPVGGHNLLEPARWGKPVFFGPHTDHCAEVAELLLRAGGGVQVRDGQELVAEMARWLGDRSGLRRMGDAARQVVLDNQGAVERSLQIIEKVLVRGYECGMMNDECRLTDSKDQIRNLAHALPHSSFIVHHSSLLRWPLLALAFPYGLVVRARAVLYKHGLLPRRSLPCRVVSVGNLTVGGTGKTPVVILIAEWLLARGLRVGVLSRGYRRQGRASFVLVSDGRSVLTGPAEAGDEPYLIARRCPGAVVAVGADRYRLGQWVLERFPIDCFLLDDGFQHLALNRDVDLLLVDASDPASLWTLLPAGRLREPLSTAARATAILVTRADTSAGLNPVLEPIREATGLDRQPILIRFKAEGFVDVLTGEIQENGRVSGRTALAFSGIGHPTSFRTLLADQGIKVLDELVFPDHHDY
ncbi:MAG: tetraacyldisaccharide 4'-kinase, partial [Nitrospiraceae bacterium]